jgi:hypothetical protein
MRDEIRMGGGGAKPPGIGLFVMIVIIVALCKVPFVLSEQIYIPSSSWLGITIVDSRVPSLAFRTMISSAYVAKCGCHLM